jgi:hypothetical protein
MRVNDGVFSRFLLKNKYLTHIIIYYLIIPIYNLICMFIYVVYYHVVFVCVTIDGVLNN